MDSTFEIAQVLAVGFFEIFLIGIFTIYPFWLVKKYLLE